MQAGAEHEVSLQQGLGADENVGDLLLNGIHAKNVGDSRWEGNPFLLRTFEGRTPAQPSSAWQDFIRAIREIRG
jgi:hypothetical protein